MNVYVKFQCCSFSFQERTTIWADVCKRHSIWKVVNISRFLTSQRFVRSTLCSWLICLRVVYMPSVLWHCWLDVRKSIRPVKIDWWGVDVVVCLEWGADLHMVQLMPLHPLTLSSLASFKCRLVLPFWYRLTQVVLEKRPLNGCSSSSGSSSQYLKLNSS